MTEWEIDVRKCMKGECRGCPREHYASCGALIDEAMKSRKQETTKESGAHEENEAGGTDVFGNTVPEEENEPRAEVDATRSDCDRRCFYGGDIVCGLGALET